MYAIQKSGMSPRQKYANYYHFMIRKQSDHAVWQINKDLSLIKQG
jgi:hypothetical protein